MKKRTPSTEPHTPADAAQLTAAMQQTQAEMADKGSRAIAACLQAAWSDETDPPLAEPTAVVATIPAMERARMAAAAQEPLESADAQSTASRQAVQPKP